MAPLQLLGGRNRRMCRVASCAPQVKFLWHNFTCKLTLLHKKFCREKRIILMQDSVILKLKQSL